MNVIGFFYMMDPGYLLVVLVGGALSLLAAGWVKASFAKYSKVATSSGMTGAQAAAAVMRAGGVTGVTVEEHRGFLSDHYDPRARALRLSPQVYSGRSVSAVAVAAHEAGHAIQHARKYAPLMLRSAIVPIASIGDKLWIVPFFIGIATNVAGWFTLGALLFGGIVLFQLVTLPTEFNASGRAKAVLVQAGIVHGEEERRGVSRVLTAAAATYVAAVISSLLTLAYLLLRASAARD